MVFSIRWLGHASFQIEFEEKKILIDPYEGECKNKADLVLGTHSHFDHFDPSIVRRVLKGDTLVIAPEDCATKIRGRVKTLKPGEKVTLGKIAVEAVEAYNYKRFRSPGNPFHPKGSGVGYLISVGDRTIYHAGDTDLIPEMKQIKNIHLALLPTGGTYTMNDEEAAEAALTINPEVVIPIHRLDAKPEVFREMVESSSKIKVVILKPGEKIEVH